MTSDLPSAFGQYRVVEKLGEGGMGVVYLAVSPEFRLVAVKALRPWMVGGNESRARFAREVALMRRVRGPRVGEVLDADVDADPAYLVTRYVRGPALPTAVADHGALQGEALTDVAVGLLDALTTVHAAGLVHRDVKPGNVLMSGRDPVLIDFGLARAGDETRLTTTGMIAGTPGYLAPETVLGDDATTGTDVHGWAATVAFAGTGRPPFGTGPDSVVLDRIRRGDHNLEGLPEPIASAVRAALHDDPAKRPSVAELLQDLRGDEPADQSPAAVAIAPPPPPRQQDPAEHSSHSPEAAGHVAPASETPASGTPAGVAGEIDSEATEAFEVVPDRPEDADTDETAVVSLADQTPTVTDAPPVPADPRPSERTVVMARGAPASNPPPPRQQPAPSQPAPRPPQEHPYAGDGAPLRAWPPRMVVMTAGLALVIMAAYIPWVGATVLLLAMITGRIVWRVRRRMYERLIGRRGAGKHDRLIVGLGTPADLLLVFLPSLGQAAVALGAGVLVGLALNPANEAIGEVTPILVGAATAVTVAWWGPGAARFRHGIRVLVAPTERYHRVGWTVAAVFFITAWVFAVLLEVMETSWWPGSDPPNPLDL